MGHLRGTSHLESAIECRCLASQVEKKAQLLYDYIRERGTIVPIHTYDADLLRKGDVSRVVTEGIRRGTSDWEKLVPEPVKDQVAPSKDCSSGCKVAMPCSCDRGCLTKPQVLLLPLLLLIY
jgi:hypothetical protein